MKLSPDYLDKITTAQRRLELRDDDEPGLSFRVASTGAKSWSVRYVTSAGEHRRKSLGRYPDVGLARARVLARKAKGSIAEKIDIVGLAKEAKQEAERKKLERMDILTDNYFADAVRGVHRTRARAKSGRTIEEEKEYWERDVKPVFGKRPVSSITRREILAFIDRMTRRSPGAGRHCHTLIRQLMSYAVLKEVIDANPALNVPTIEAVPRNHFLNDNDLRAVWQALRDPDTKARLSLAMSLLLRMALIAPLRVSEVAGMRWNEIDRAAKLWIIPAKRMKGKRFHVMPLSDMALNILDIAETEIANAEYVFPSPRNKLPFEANAASRAMRRLTTRQKITPATPHDFRRTAMTNLTSVERIGVSRFIAKQLLAHKDNDMTGKHYDMNDYLAEKRFAANAWAVLLQSIIEGTAPASNVINMRKAAS